MNDGANPIRWDCGTRGCFNRLRRPKIEHFATCFPGRIAMSDIDATVEVNSHFVFLEMKSHQGDIPLGQRLYFERLTRLSPRIVALILCGDAETMRCEAMRWIYEGRLSDWQPASFADVAAQLRAFSTWATGQHSPAAQASQPDRPTLCPAS
jgi:hypothetical protein